MKRSLSQIKISFESFSGRLNKMEEKPGLGDKVYVIENKMKIKKKE
jgi:hypothetical protein